MACCAFAVFLLTQMLLPFRAAARALGVSNSRLRPDPAVLWQPGVAVGRAGRRRSRRLLFGGLLLADGLLLGLLAQSGMLAELPRFAPDRTRAAELEAYLHATICGDRRGSV